MKRDMEKEMSMIIPEPKQIVPRQGFVVDEGKHICAGRESFSPGKTLQREIKRIKGFSLPLEIVDGSSMRPEKALSYPQRSIQAGGRLGTRS